MMAEGVGFEPTNGLPHCRFSRPMLSTAQPPLQGNELVQFNIFFISLIQQLKIKVSNILKFHETL